MTHLPWSENVYTIEDLQFGEGEEY
jgi:hypothetical protein